MNQEVQSYLRAAVSLAQYDWVDHLAACQLAINNRDTTTVGVSPNRLLNGFDIEAVPVLRKEEAARNTPRGRAVHFLRHLREGTDLAQAAMAFAQQQQRDAANRHRRPAEAYRVGDKVWLSLRNIKTDRPCKKLDWLYAKYTVVAVPSPLVVTLDVPGDKHPSFHVELVERAADDPLPSQGKTDTQPPPVMVPQLEDGDLEPEYRVEEIVAARNARGRGNQRQVLVKWQGYDNLSWHPLRDFEDTRALEEFESKWGSARSNDGPKSNRARRKAGGNEVRVGSLSSCTANSGEEGLTGREKEGMSWTRALARV
jgi:hypothetical protein